MYRKHFGLTRHPFGKDIADRRAVRLRVVARARARASQHLVELRGIGLVTGESGCGKTTACRKVVAALHTGPATASSTCRCPPATSWTSTSPSPGSWACPPSATAPRSTAQIRTEVYPPVRRDRTAARCSIVDEAHHLRTDVLEDLRLLTNYAMDSENRLCLLLVGQPELRRRLGHGGPRGARPAHRRALPPRAASRATRCRPTSRTACALAGTELPLFEPARRRGASTRPPAACRARSTSSPTTPCRRRARQGQGRHRRARAGRDAGGVVMPVRDAALRPGPARSRGRPANLGVLATLDQLLLEALRFLLNEHPTLEDAACVREDDVELLQLGGRVLNRILELRDLLERYRDTDAKPRTALTHDDIPF